MTSQHSSSVLYILHYSLKHTLKPLQRSTLDIYSKINRKPSVLSGILIDSYCTCTHSGETHGETLTLLRTHQSLDACGISNKILQFQDWVLFPLEFGLHGALLRYVFMRHKYGVRKEFIMLCLSLFNCFPRTQWEQLESK